MISTSSCIEFECDHRNLPNRDANYVTKIISYEELGDQLTVF